MIITCVAHAMFCIELESGTRVVTDPVNGESGYPVQPVQADIVLVSHHHQDHDALDSVKGYRYVIDKASPATELRDIRVTAVRGWHDDALGAKRGESLLFLVEAEGLRIVHAGDLGTLPSGEQLKALGRVDVLMVPVGGCYTLDADQAQKTAELLKARVVIPMHYRTSYIEDWPIADEQPFLSLYPEDQVYRQRLLRITAGDLSVQPRICLLTPRLA